MLTYPKYFQPKCCIQDKSKRLSIVKKCLHCIKYKYTAKYWIKILPNIWHIFKQFSFTVSFSLHPILICAPLTNCKVLTESVKTISFNAYIFKMNWTFAMDISKIYFTANETRKCKHPSILAHAPVHTKCIHNYSLISLYRCTGLCALFFFTSASSSSQSLLNMLYIGIC